MQKVILLIALVIGLGVAYVDSRPTWDDTAITVLVIMASSGMLGLFTTRRPWLLALAIGLWLPLVEVITTGKFVSLAALAFAFIGAYAGWAIGKLARKTERAR